MAQHKQSLEKTIQSAFKHKKAGTEVATTIVAIEAMILTASVTQKSIVENSDAKILGRCRAALAHKSFGKRMADALSTIDAIIAADNLVVVAEDMQLKGQHKQGLRKVAQGAVANKSLGTKISDMVSKTKKALDLLVDANPSDSDLAAIKDTLDF